MKGKDNQKWRKNLKHNELSQVVRKKIIVTCIYKFLIQQNAIQIESTSKQMKQVKNN